jgi:protein-L-isoaspartate O-methyltransferase
MTVSSDASDAALTLAASLHAAGFLPAACVSAFETVRREQFIPDKVWVQRDDDGPYVPVDRVNEPGRWLGYVYSDRVIVTQFDDGQTVWPAVGSRPTCSASMPSAVAGMLAALDVQDGHAVLEIGTGTGFNAALLAALAGRSGTVTSLEIDGRIATAARRDLDRAGYPFVDVHTHDAAAEPVNGEFDRIIATASVHLGHLPYSWVASTRPGGVLLAPMRADLGSGPLVRFTVDDHGVARGRAVPLRVGFMELRSHRVRSLPRAELVWDAAGQESTTSVSPFPMLLGEASRWAVAVAVPSCRYAVEPRTAERDHGVAWLTDPVSESWARIAPKTHSTYVVRQFGPRRLWDEAEAAYRWWEASGKPGIEDWEWVVAPDRQSVSLP